MSDRRFRFLGCADLLTAEDRKSLHRFNFWLLLWAFWFAALLVILDRGILGTGAWKWFAALVPTVIGVFAMRSYVLFLRRADELLRKIQLEGLAIGFGAGIIAMSGYRLLEKAGAPRIDIEQPMVVMLVFWGIGQYLAARRYA